MFISQTHACLNRYAPNVDKIFGVPAEVSEVFVFDPLTNSTGGFGDLGSASGKWYNAVYAANVGKIYAVPGLASVILVIDPVINATALLGLGAIRGQLNWANGALYVCSSVSLPFLAIGDVN